MHPNYLFILTFQHIYSRVDRFRNIKILWANEVYEKEMTLFDPPPPPLTKEILIWYKLNELMLWGVEREREREGRSLSQVVLYQTQCLRVGRGGSAPCLLSKGRGTRLRCRGRVVRHAPSRLLGRHKFWHASQSDLQFKMEKLPQKYFLRFQISDLVKKIPNSFIN